MPVDKFCSSESLSFALLVNSFVLLLVESKLFSLSVFQHCYQLELPLPLEVFNISVQ